MTEVFKGIGDTLTLLYDSLISILPSFLQKFIAFFLIALLIVLYGFVVWKFYKSISKKDILGLDLNKYNKTKHPLITKFVAGALYLVEYIFVSPLIIFLWFALLTILLIAITESIPAGTVLIISGLMIASIRIISYSNRDLAQDIAKIVPLTLLATSFLNPNFFSVTRILGTFAEIPGLFGEIGIYLVFIIFLEIILRLFDFVFSLFQIESPVKKKDEEE